MKKCKATKLDGTPCNNPAKDGSDYCYLPTHGHPEDEPLDDKERRFVEEYLVDFNKSAAARRIGYEGRTAGTMGCMLYQRERVAKAIQKRLDDLSMSSEEAIKRMTDWGRGNLLPFLEEDGIFGGYRINANTPDAKENMHLVKKVKTNEFGIITEIELHDAKDAVDKILKIHGKYIDHVKIQDITPEPWDEEEGDPEDYVQQKISK